MVEGPSDSPPLFAHCAVCGAAIRWGDTAVTVSRTNERVAPDGDVDIIDGDWLASLCATCGPRYPAGSIRVTFGPPSG